PMIVGVAMTYVTHSLLFGILSGLGAFVLMIAVALKMTGPGIRVGSRAWEAQMNVDLLDRVIAQRTAEQRQEQDAAKRDRLGREIAFLSQQLDENARIWQSGDPAPGKGYVGFEAYKGD